MLKGRKILLGITGSIAAYKSILLLRLLTKEGAEVKVVMTPAAAEFVSPLVLSTLSNNKVMMELFEGDQWANHVMLGRWADLFIIAPASCNTISKMAIGLCDNLLMSVYLSATCPVLICPAMDEDMWLHPATKSNLAKLRSFGNMLMDVDHGELASGLTGEGRMPEPENILTFAIEHFFREKTLSGKKLLITAGPTYEALDPVRFIGNHSSGKMGIALAEAFFLKGAEVILVTGPVSMKTVFKGIKTVAVKSAEEMLRACEKEYASSQIMIMSAAVADFTPESYATEKIKKTDGGLQLNLKKTTDILAFLGERKRDDQLLIGFALETENEEENALKKLKKKNADLIILNSLNDAGAGFGHDTNQVKIFDKNGTVYFFELAAKKVIASQIADMITEKFYDEEK